MAEKEQEKNQFVKQVAEQKYEFGFTTDVHTEIIEKGLNEDVVRLISQKKGEPDWMLEFRLKAYNYWKTLKEPKWGHVHVPPIDYQEISYYADPLAKKPKNKEIDPELEKTFDKLGIPLEERLALSGTAVDAIMDSVSVKTTFKEKLREKGVIFCSILICILAHVAVLILLCFLLCLAGFQVCFLVCELIAVIRYLLYQIHVLLQALSVVFV